MAKKVTFILPAETAGTATTGLVLGEFNNWNEQDGISLEKQQDGSLTAIASLAPGKRYEYRYLLNDGRWVNDNSAIEYVSVAGLSVENCVIDLTGIAEEAPEVEIATVEIPAAIVAEPVKVATKKVAVAKEKKAPAKPVASKAKTTKPKDNDTKA